VIGGVLTVADEELKTIIDKLAQFVARNGPEFEQMTKNKQRDNPRFYFLFGGQYFQYYQYRVSAEQHQHHQQQQQQLIGGQQPQPSQPPPQPPPLNNMWQNNGLNTSLDQLTQQINELKEQMRQSEANLTAQHQVLMQQKQIIIEDVVRQSQEEQLRRMADEFNVDLNDFESVLLPIAENCTKEAIAVRVDSCFRDFTVSLLM
jgi:calcium homeostasis ER protein